MQPREPLGKAHLPFISVSRVLLVKQDTEPTWEEEGLPSVANMDVSAVRNDSQARRASCLHTGARCRLEGAGPWICWSWLVSRVLRHLCLSLYTGRTLKVSIKYLGR